MEVKDKLVTLEDQKIAFDNLNGKISTLSTQVSTNTTDIATLNSNLSQLNSDKAGYIFYESAGFSAIDGTITLPDSFNVCKVVLIALAKYGRLSTPYIMVRGYGTDTGQIKFECGENAGWNAIVKGTTVQYKGIYGNLGLGIPYVIAFGLKTPLSL